MRAGFAKDTGRIRGIGWRWLNWSAYQSGEPLAATLVVSHCPAKSMVKQRHPPESEHLGDGWLAKQIEVVKPRLVVSAHFRGGYGRAERDGTTCINCSLASEAREFSEQATGSGLRRDDLDAFGSNRRRNGRVLVFFTCTKTGPALS